MSSVPASGSQQRLRQEKLVLAPPSDVPRLTADHPLLAKEKIPELLEQYRPLFTIPLKLQAISLEGRQLGNVLNNKKIASHFFNAVGYRHVRPHPNGEASKRIVVLNVHQGQPFPEELEQEVVRLGFDRMSFDVELGWDHLSSDAVLEAMLPSDIVAKEGVPTGFTIVGHIAHLNLIDLYLPFRYLVGAVIVEKNATSIRTVVNKLDTIDTQFRFFKMELLAGDDDYTAHVSESDCSFTFDFRTVYWNSRLHGEHARLIRRFRPNQVMSDVMAGVGPFAVPAAKKGVWVLANDLNPKSYESLCVNGKTNHVLEYTQDDADGARDNHNLDGGLFAFCKDGREFIRESAKVAWKRGFPGRPVGFGMGDAGDEKLREFARKTIKARTKAKRAEHAKRHEEKKLAAAAAVQGEAMSPTVEPTEADAGVAAAAAPAALKTHGDNFERHAPRRLIDHFVMNLPASALEFLDAFRGLYTHLAAEVGLDALNAEIARRDALASSSTASSSSECDDSQEPLPWVHVHCFSKDPLRPGLDVLRRANRAMGILDTPHQLIATPVLPPQTSTASRRSNRFLPTKPEHGDVDADGDPVSTVQTTAQDLDRIAHFQSTEELMQFLNDEFQRLGVQPTPDVEIHYVRDVAPNKQMYCLSFRLPRQVLFAPL
ncbi:tRNA(m(1)G37)methyltransferase [Thecaphora frezii]